MAASAPGFLFGFAFGPQGKRELRSLQEAAAAPPPDELFRWLHLDALSSEAQAWLRQQEGLDAHALKAALAPRARPRMSHFGDTLLVVVRAANLNEGKEREDLVSLRLLVRPRILISLRRARIQAAEKVAEEVRGGLGFREPAELLAHLIHFVSLPLHDFIEEIGGRLDDFEVSVADPAQSPERGDLFDLRRELIALRKSLVPQREALDRLYREPHPTLGPHQRTLLREPAHRMARLVDEVEAARERAGVLMEEMGMQATEELNRRIYLFTVIAGIFMPLTFLASMLGMNVAGIPLADHRLAFLAVCVIMVAIGAGIWQLLRSNRWL